MAKPDGQWRHAGRLWATKDGGVIPGFSGSWIRWYKANAETPINAKIIKRGGRRHKGDLRRGPKVYEWTIYGPGFAGIRVNLDGGTSKTLAGAKRACDRAASLIR